MPATQELWRQLSGPSWPAGAPFRRGDRVEVWWRRDWAWYAGTVTAAYEDQQLCVCFDDPGFWGLGARGLDYDCLRPLGPAEAAKW